MMKASELQALLEKLIEDHGDRPVYLEIGHYAGEPTEVYVDGENDFMITTR